MDRGLSFGVGSPSHLEDVLSFACQIKLSCDRAVTVVCCFKSLLWLNRTKDSPDTSNFPVFFLKDDSTVTLKSHDSLTAVC